MSPRDDDMIRPEEERALDALIASQADTSISEETADRLLSFLQVGDPAAASVDAEDQGPVASGVLDAETPAAGTLPGLDVGSSATPSRRFGPVRIAASVAVALAMGAAALLLLHSRSNPASGDETPETPISPASSKVAKDLPPPAATPTATPTASPALRVTGWGRRKPGPKPAGDPILVAWSGRWVAGVDADDLLLALREACAAVQPWPEAPVPVGRMQEPGHVGEIDRATGLAVESLAVGSRSAMPGLSRSASRQQRVLLGTAWLLSRVERGAMPRAEILEPARLLLTAEGRFRRDLVRLFRESDVRIDKMLPPQGRTVSEPLAGLCGALGTSRAPRVLARAGLRAQRAAIVQSLQTGDRASLGFALDLLLLGHRLSPNSDKVRLAPFEAWDGDSWRVLQQLLEERVQRSSNHSERSFLEGLRERLLSKS